MEKNLIWQWPVGSIAFGCSSDDLFVEYCYCIAEVLIFLSKQIPPNCPFPLWYLELHEILRLLGPPELTPHMASWSVQPFCRAPGHDQQTHTHADCGTSRHLEQQTASCICAMHPMWPVNADIFDFWPDCLDRKEGVILCALTVRMSV